MVVKSFEDLDVFQKSYQLSLTLHKVSLTLPRIEQFALADQIRRASKSIPVNIAEGFGKQVSSKNEFGRFLTIAIGSSDEMRVWIRYMLDLGYIEEATWQQWNNDYQIIAKMLQALKKKLG